ncbi:MAG TPA: TRAP transporter large permease [Acidimicrobiia bacterium]|nr:TRAP transporter large permease [Acidimicrobiia bacterium]
MDPVHAALIAVGLLLLLLAIRAPVALGLLVAGAVGLLLTDGFTIAEITLTRRSLEAVGRYVLIVIPFFLAMGVLVKESGIAQDLFAVAQRVFRRVPGGLAVATIFACSAFGAISGSSVATVASIGRIAIREMRALGYRVSVAAGAVGASGTLSVMIPPSIAMVLYGIVTGESIGRMLIAGIVPGILTAVSYSIAVMARAALRPAAFYATATAGAGGSAGGNVSLDGSTNGSPRQLPYRSVIETAVLVTIVMGGIYTGFVTVVEAASLGAVAALVIFLLRRHRDAGARLRRLRTSLLETTQLNAMTFLLLVGSGIFSYMLVSAGIPRDLARFVASVDISPMLTVIILLVIFIPLGMFLDPIAMLLIAVPLTYPIAVTELGFDGIWYGILVVKMTELALITPPLGLNAFVIAGVSEDVTVEDTFAGSLWYVPVDFAVIVLLFAFPGIVTWLPNLMM